MVIQSFVSVGVDQNNYEIFIWPINARHFLAPNLCKSRFCSRTTFRKKNPWNDCGEMLDRLRLTENFARSKYESKNAKNSLKHCRLSYLIIRINLLSAVVHKSSRIPTFKYNGSIIYARSKKPSWDASRNSNGCDFDNCKYD